MAAVITDYQLETARICTSKSAHIVPLKASFLDLDEWAKHSPFLNKTYEGSLEPSTGFNLGSHSNAVTPDRKLPRAARRNRRVISKKKLSPGIGSQASRQFVGIKTKRFKGRNHGLHLSGLSVQHVNLGSQADLAGVHKGFRITHFNQKRVTSPHELTTLIEDACLTNIDYTIRFTNDAEEVSVRVLNNRENVFVTVSIQDTIADIKELVETENGLPSKYMRVFVNLRRRNDREVLQDILKESKEEMTLKRRQADTSYGLQDLFIAVEHCPLFDIPDTALAEALDLLCAPSELPHIHTKGTAPITRRAWSRKPETDIKQRKDVKAHFNAEFEPKEKPTNKFLIYTGIRVRRLIWQAWWDWVFDKLASSQFPRPRSDRRFKKSKSRRQRSRHRTRSRESAPSEADIEESANGSRGSRSIESMDKPSNRSRNRSGNRSRGRSKQRSPNIPRRKSGSLSPAKRRRRSRSAGVGIGRRGRRRGSTDMFKKSPNKSIGNQSPEEWYWGSVLSFESLCGAGPPMLRKFRGTIAERHWETIVMQAALGSDRWFEEIIEPDLSKDWLQMVTELESLDGPDVYFNGKVLSPTEECVWGRGIDPNSKTRLRRNSSGTKFGTLFVMRSPFCAIFQFEDSMEMMAFTSRDRTLLAGLLQDNLRNYTIRLKRMTRLRLRSLHGYEVEVKADYRLMGQKKKDTKVGTFEFIDEEEGSAKQAPPEVLGPFNGSPVVAGWERAEDWKRHRHGKKGMGGVAGWGKIRYEAVNLSVRPSYAVVERKANKRSLFSLEPPKGWVKSKDNRYLEYRLKPWVDPETAGWTLALNAKLTFNNLHGLVLGLLRQAEVHPNALTDTIEKMREQRDARFAARSKGLDVLSHQFWWEVYQNDGLSLQTMGTLREYLRKYEPALYEEFFILIKYRSELQDTYERLEMLESSLAYKWWFIFWLRLRLIYGEIAPDPLAPDSIVKDFLPLEKIEEILEPINTCRNNPADAPDNLPHANSSGVSPMIHTQKPSPGVHSRQRSRSPPVSGQGGGLGGRRYGARTMSSVPSVLSTVIRKKMGRLFERSSVLLKNSALSIKATEVLQRVSDLKEHDELRKFWAKHIIKEKNKNIVVEERPQENNPKSDTFVRTPTCIQEQIDVIHRQRSKALRLKRSREKKEKKRMELSDNKMDHLPAKVRETFQLVGALVRHVKSPCKMATITLDAEPNLKRHSQVVANESDESDFLSDEKHEPNLNQIPTESSEEDQLQEEEKKAGMSLSSGPLGFLCTRQSTIRRIQERRDQREARRARRRIRKGLRGGVLRGEYTVGDFVEVFSKRKKVWIKSVVVGSFMGRSLDPNNANQLEKYLSISYLTHKGHKDVAVSSRDLRPLPDDTIVGKEAGNSSPNGGAERSDHSDDTETELAKKTIHGLWRDFIKVDGVDGRCTVLRKAAFEGEYGERRFPFVELINQNHRAQKSSDRLAMKITNQLSKKEIADVFASVSAGKQSEMKSKMLNDAKLTLAAQTNDEARMNPILARKVQPATRGARPANMATESPVGQSSQASLFSSNYSLPPATPGTPGMDEKLALDIYGPRSPSGTPRKLQVKRVSSDPDEKKRQKRQALKPKGPMRMVTVRDEGLKDSAALKTWVRLLEKYSDHNTEILTHQHLTHIIHHVVKRMQTQKLGVILHQEWSLRIVGGDVMNSMMAAGVLEEHGDVLHVDVAKKNLARLGGSNVITLRDFVHVFRSALKVDSIRLQKQMVMWSRNEVGMRAGEMTWLVFKQFIRRCGGDLIGEFLRAPPEVRLTRSAKRVTRKNI